MPKRVLITGARAAAALDLARDFAADGWEVHCADNSPARIARWSAAVRQVHHCAPPTRDPNGFQKDLKRLLQQLKPDLIVPTCEEVFHLAAPGLAKVLEGRLFAPPLATLRQLHDKHAFASACHDWGLAAPETHVLTSRNDLATIADNPAQWIFKPSFSRFGEATLSDLTSKDILNLNIDRGSPILAQRRVRGREVCFYAVAQSGTLSVFASYQSQWRLGGGASFAFSPIPKEMEGQLKIMAQKLAHHTQITGQFACDAIVDADGKAWLIECNPRATSGVHLLAGTGALARAIADGAPMRESATSTRYLAPAMFAFGLPLALRTGRMAEWRAMMRNGRDAISRPGDRMPVLGALADAAGFALSGLRQGISTTSATTRDIEWNGEELP